MAEHEFLTLLSLFCQRESLTRAECIAELDQPRNTVSSRIQALRDAGWIRRVGVRQAETLGRPTEVFALDEERTDIVVIDFSQTETKARIASLRGTTRASASSVISLAADPPTALRAAARLTLNLLANIDRSPAQVVIAVVSVASPVDDEQRPVNPVIQPSTLPVDLIGILTRSLGIPVLVENDANVRAMGHVLRTGTQDLIHLQIGDGIGVGAALRGHLHRGSIGLAGEIGHVPVPTATAASIRCGCGLFGCLGVVAGAKAVAAAAGVTDLHDLAERVDAGESRAVAAIRSSAELIASVVVPTLLALAPSLLAIGGPLVVAVPSAGTAVADIVRSRTLPAFAHRLQIITAPDDHELVVQGGIALSRQWMSDRLSVSPRISPGLR